MRMCAAIGGCILLVLVLMDGFDTIILARRTRHMLQFARGFYRITWAPVSAVARTIQSGHTRENFLGIYGPLSLIALMGLWIAGLIVSFGLLQWGVHMQPAHTQPTFVNDLY